MRRCSASSFRQRAASRWCARRGPSRRRAEWVLVGGLVVAAMGGAVAVAQRSGEPQYQIVLPDEVTVELGVDASVSLTLAGRTGYTISREAPLAVDLSGDSRLDLAKTNYRRGDAADVRADNPRFDLRFRALGEGEHRLDVAIRFWVCTRRTCRPVREHRTATITARSASAPTDGGVAAD